MSIQQAESSTHELEHKIEEAESLRDAVMRSMEAAAMCWDDPTKAGEFHPQCAANVGEALLRYLDINFKLVPLEHEDPRRLM